MATWKKITPSEGSLGGLGRRPRTKFAVSRQRTGQRNTYFFVPVNIGVTAPKADIYTDGNGKIAFRFCASGDFSVNGKPSHARRVIIPAGMADRIPFGTHDVEVTRDGDMYVLDLTQLDGVQS